MKREILFRGKPMFRESNDFVYGYYKQDDIAGVKTDFILPLPEYKNEINEVAVCPLTVGQFTGLTDKNGVKIFEGDIVNVKTINGSFINYVITWFNSDLCWTIQSLKDTSVRFGLRSCWEFEVVDNIHDNPELLKGEK